MQRNAFLVFAEIPECRVFYAEKYLIMLIYRLCL